MLEPILSAARFAAAVCCFLLLFALIIAFGAAFS